MAKLIAEFSFYFFFFFDPTDTIWISDMGSWDYFGFTVIVLTLLEIALNLTHSYIVISLILTSMMMFCLLEKRLFKIF